MDVIRLCNKPTLSWSCLGSCLVMRTKSELLHRPSQASNLQSGFTSLLGRTDHEQGRSVGLVLDIGIEAS
jgi:hypothetical protein